MPSNFQLDNLDPMQALELVNTLDAQDANSTLTEANLQFQGQQDKASFDRSMADLQRAFSRQFPRIGANYAARGLGSSGLVKGAQRNALEDLLAARSKVQAGYDVAQFNTSQAQAANALQNAATYQGVGQQLALYGASNPYASSTLTPEQIAALNWLAGLQQS